MILPADRRINLTWVAKRDEVDAADGEWVQIAEATSSNIAHRVRTGEIQAFRPAGTYEAKTFRVPGDPKKRVEVWVRKVS